MNNYQTIENAVACIKCECEEIKARGVDASGILTALHDATNGKTPFDYDLSGVREEVDKIDCEQLSDVIRDIKRNCSTVDIAKEHLRMDKKEFYDILIDIVGPNLSEQIADILLAKGAQISDN